jgi:hypothetical protein
MKPAILQCRTPQETNPEGHWRPNYFLRNSHPNGDVDLLAGSESPERIVLEMFILESHIGELPRL